MLHKLAPILCTPRNTITLFIKSLHIYTHLVRLFFPVNPTCIKKIKDSFHQCKAYFPNQLRTDITVEDDWRLVPLFVQLHSKTSSCRDTSCACRAAPQCGCLRTRANSNQLQQRMCPAAVIIMANWGSREQYWWKPPIICTWHCSGNMLKGITFEYWRLQSGFSWKAAIVSGVLWV